jgi:hypothetical protein
MDVQDTSFSGEPAQCDPETCDYMRKEMAFAGLQGLDDSYQVCSHLLCPTWLTFRQYKYMIDVDGNAWSGRFHRLMSTKSLVLKSTVFPECTLSYSSHLSKADSTTGYADRRKLAPARIHTC